ncbi:hypothetical protein B1R32_10376 [Abditibacterium utsteinense]|uniref:Uncharacterized protein n=1 Tax=Abditibacterium utsteinense TaxID=1960156 RepID=A0A2S8SVJ7_9BACT|nr:hypothetical protein [Abditibacterium utsteinense]PQV64809.1 hypothetical protein B1R32_10376 [Abditibacterium utsteinense]
MADSPTFKPGDRVEIGGRTMLRPGFSLVGLTGVVFASAPNVPDGCLTVAVDWPAHGYTEENGYADGSLPLFVNVPAAHLSDADAPEELKPKPKFTSKSQLSSLLGKTAPAEPEARESSVEEPAMPKPAASKTAPKPDDETPNERPKLRLV